LVIGSHFRHACFALPMPFRCPSFSLLLMAAAFFVDDYFFIPLRFFADCCLSCLFHITLIFRLATISCLPFRC